MVPASSRRSVVQPVGDCYTKRMGASAPKEFLAGSVCAKGTLSVKPSRTFVDGHHSLPMLKVSQPRGLCARHVLVCVPLHGEGQRAARPDGQ